MGDYSVPKEVRELRPPGTMVKKINGAYYVYQYSLVRRMVKSKGGTDKEKSVVKMGACVGRITLEDGYIPNDNALRYDEVTVLNYGAYAFVLEFSKNVLDQLKAVFNAGDANQIYCVACLYVIEGFTYMKNVDSLYKESLLCRHFPNVHMGHIALHTLFHNLGSKGSKVDRFEQNLIDESSKRIAIDGHVIACTSNENDLSAYGYKARELKREQVNWMTAYDIDTRQPLTSQIFNGADPDQTVIGVLFSRFEFRDTLFVVDRGFNYASDKQQMSENGNSYIVPMIHGRKDYNYVREHMFFDRRRTFVYTTDENSTLVYYWQCIIGNTRHIAYKDTIREAADRQSYIKKMRSGKPGYTEEGLKENEEDFGLFLLETSELNRHPREVFKDYKSRWRIETFYDYIDNSVDFNALYQQDYCSMQGLSFIIQVAGMIYHDLRKVLDPLHLSLKDVLAQLRGIKAVREREVWRIRNTTKKKRELCEMMGLSLPTTIS